MDTQEWTTVALNKKQLCFLDNISKKSKFSGGRKFSRTAVMRAILEASKRLNIDVRGLKTEGDFKEKVIISYKKALISS
jgi:hypothetical protein